MYIYLLFLIPITWFYLQFLAVNPFYPHCQAVRWTIKGKGHNGSHWLRQSRINLHFKLSNFNWVCVSKWSPNILCDTSFAFSKVCSNWHWTGILSRFFVLQNLSDTTHLYLLVFCEYISSGGNKLGQNYLSF